MKFLWKKIVILREKQHVLSILSQRDSKLTYIQHNFNILHGHGQTINAYNSTENMWSFLHGGLKKSLLSSDHLKEILRKHCAILYNYPDKFRVDERLEEYLLHVWAEFSYGDKIDFYQYRECRMMIVNLLKNNFHNSYLVKVPLLGSLYCRYIYWRTQSLRNKINLQLNQFAKISVESQKGFIYNFHKLLVENQNIDDSVVNEQNASHLLIDNSFLLFLVIDFVHKVLLDYLLRFSLSKKKNELIDHAELFKHSLSCGFLYPYRYRWMNSSIELTKNDSLEGNITLKEGDLIIFDLKESHLYFSGGQRSCIGQGLVRNAFYDFFTNEILKNKYLEINHDEIEYDENSVNIPELKHYYIGNWTQTKHSDREMIQKLKCYEGHKGVKYYNVLNLYSDISTFEYIVDDICNNIKDIRKDIDGLVGIETRGLSLAGALSYKLKLPLFTIRKQGQLPGEKFQEEYKTAYSTDIIELCKDDDIKGKNIMLIDDGIATGGTSLAGIKLIEKAGGKVVKFVTMINHTYKPRITAYEPYNQITYSCFSLLPN